MKNIIIFLVLSLFLTPTFSATAPSGGGGGWSSKTVTRVALTDVIEATARQQAIRNGTAVTLEAVVQETINRQAVGKVLLKRLFAGGVLIGATQSLLDGVGWVMEDGVYVKYKEKPEKEPNYPVLYRNTSGKDTAWFGNPEAACQDYPKATGSYVFKYAYTLTTGNKGCYYQSKLTSPPDLNFSPVQFQFGYRSKVNNNYDPNKEPEKERIVLTPDLMGDLAVGDYTDPVDRTKDKKDKVWTDVENAYKPDVDGNDLNDKINNKLDNAPETNNKPKTPPKPDGDGQKYPAPDEKPGGQGETENTTNPETGNQTGNFTLPDWCLWAADQCQWHKEEKEVWKEEKNQRDSEKSFWQKVTDWFDWTKEAPEKEEEPDRPEIDEKGIFSRTFDTVFSLSKQCPPDVPYTLETQYLKGNFTISLNWLCVIFTFLGYPLQLIAHLTGLWILYETVVRKEIKW